MRNLRLNFPLRLITTLIADFKLTGTTGNLKRWTTKKYPKSTNSNFAIIKLGVFKILYNHYAN
ncbi:hypothetical protein CP371_08750 [Pediococcus acidilactici]|nr:hypothetical protein A4V11_05325 [Pediococcus acidilactici]MCQ0050784.1 hypothetical protein [Pediococcus acidilactici]MCQ0052633.1 hypothetical protein [Pediococcus acidilactici]MCQ0055420.1 hypothetical protein [Pediococcus acidilactici]MCQ0062145.1 hypothetical protein [Pediococcus acidilactici]